MSNGDLFFYSYFHFWFFTLGVLGLIFSLPKARGRLVYRSWHSLVPELAPLDAPFRGVSVVPSWSTEPSVLVRDVNATLGFTGVISFARLASPNLCLTRHLRSDFDSPSLSTVCDATTSVSTLYHSFDARFHGRSF